jgi:hypothetical protein
VSEHSADYDAGMTSNEQSSIEPPARLQSAEARQYDCPTCGTGLHGYGAPCGRCQARNRCDALGPLCSCATVIPPAVHPGEVSS